MGLMGMSEVDNDDYREQFKAEYRQVAIRRSKLKTMLSKWDNGLLKFSPNCPRGIYDIQLRAMDEYIAVLEARAIIEGIQL